MKFFRVDIALISAAAHRCLYSVSHLYDDSEDTDIATLRTTADQHCRWNIITVFRDVLRHRFVWSFSDRHIAKIDNLMRILCIAIDIADILTSNMDGCCFGPLLGDCRTHRSLDSG